MDPSPRAQRRLRARLLMARSAVPRGRSGRSECRRPAPSDGDDQLPVACATPPRSCQAESSPCSHHATRRTPLIQRHRTRPHFCRVTCSGSLTEVVMARVTQEYAHRMRNTGRDVTQGTGFDPGAQSILLLSREIGAMAGPCPAHGPGTSPATGAGYPVPVMPAPPIDRQSSRMAPRRGISGAPWRTARTPPYGERTACSGELGRLGRGRRRSPAEFAGKAGDGWIRDGFGPFGAVGEVTLAYSDLAEDMGWLQGNPSTLDRLAVRRWEKNPECPIRGHPRGDFDGCREGVGASPARRRVRPRSRPLREDRKSRGAAETGAAEKKERPGRSPSPCATR